MDGVEYLNLCSLFFDKVWDTCVQGSFFVVSLECYVIIRFACSVDRDLVPSFECVLEMLGVALAYEFDTEVINY